MNIKNEFMKTQIFMKKGETEMKEQRLYVCEICGTQYTEKKRALDCEKAHMRPVGFAGMKFHATATVPDWVEVVFPDGSSCRYKR